MDWSRFYESPGWELLGLTGQLTFGSRFLYQWVASERAKQSVIPVGFWWLSIVGSALIMVYAFHKGSLAFMVPTFIGVPVYVRNLWLIRRKTLQEKSEEGETKPASGEPPDKPIE